MKDKIRTLIVDDEPYNREELNYLVTKHTSIKVVGEAATGEEAVMQTIKLEPDLLFLDIEMPVMNGMQVAESVARLKKAPFIIFATAYPQFAAEAFRYEALDYLLKPYDKDQIEQALIRMESRLLALKERETPSAWKFAVEKEEEIIYIAPEDILYIGHYDKTTTFITKTGEYKSKLTLKEIEQRLADFSFYRIHKSYLVNLYYVKSISPWFNGAFHLKVEGDSELLPVSRNYIKGLRTRLEL